MITGQFEISEEVELVHLGVSGGGATFLWRCTAAPWHLARAIDETLFPVINWPVWLLHADLEAAEADLALVVHLLADGRLLVKDGRAAIVACSIGNVATTDGANTTVKELARRIVHA